ncbi:MAG: hypothetical protein ACRDN0_01565 [Trebonia sp.]
MPPVPGDSVRLADALVGKGLITPDQRKWGLAAQARSRSPLSVVVVIVAVLWPPASPGFEAWRHAVFG